MNFRSPRKRFASPKHSNQSDTSDFRAPLSTFDDIIPKGHVGKGKDTQLQFDQTIDRIFSPIKEKNYINISFSHDEPMPPMWQSNENEDLFDVLYSTPNLLLANDHPTESANKVQGDAPQPKVNIKENAAVAHKNKIVNHTHPKSSVRRGIIYHPEITPEQISRHPLKPLIDAWVVETTGGEYSELARAYPLNCFLRFLVANNVKYPVSIHISKYIDELNNDQPVFSNPDYYIRAVGRFFKWAAKRNKYPNIIENLINDLDTEKTTTNNDDQSINEPTVATVKLVGALNTWINSLTKNPIVRTNCRYEINNLILYLTQKSVVNAKPKDLAAYYQTRKFNDIRTIETFFAWVAKQGIGDNISLNIDDKLSPIQKVAIEKRKNQLEVPEEIVPLRKYIITVDDMEKSGFSYDESEHLINNELKVFNDWIETLTNSSNIIDLKRSILKFAYFLLKEAKEAYPTQDTIVAFYNKYLRDKGMTTVNNYVVSIKSFFAWTAQQMIYPDIAINCRRINVANEKYQDKPILRKDNKTKFIPLASKPLIIIQRDI